MLSQSHSLDDIYSWLIDWSSENKKPHEIISDDSDAILGASVLAFTRFKTTNEYVDSCMKTLLYERIPPECFYRLDRSHFVHSIRLNKNINRHDFRTRNLIFAVFGYLILCTDLNEVAVIARAIFTLTRNRFITSDVSDAKQLLMKLCRNHDIENKEDHVDLNTKASDFDEVDRIKSYKTTSNYEWVMDIYESIKVIDSDGNEDNIYFSPKLNSTLVYLFVRIPLWSNIMCASFKSSNLCPTSTPVENSFKEVKKLLDIKTKRADIFVENHLKYLMGGFNIAIAEQTNDSKAEAREKKTFIKLLGCIPRQSNILFIFR